MTFEIFCDVLIKKAIDGDTIRVEINGREETIRLYGIDAPEDGQPFFIDSKNFVAERAVGRRCQVRSYCRDKYGRMVARVLIDDTIDLSELMVRMGLAMVYDKYVKNHDAFYNQIIAKNERRGIWQFNNPEPPWNFRKKKKKIKESKL